MFVRNYYTYRMQFHPVFLLSNLFGVERKIYRVKIAETAQLSGVLRIKAQAILVSPHTPRISRIFPIFIDEIFNWPLKTSISTTVTNSYKHIKPTSVPLSNRNSMDISTRSCESNKIPFSFFR